jgi:hypothetical protein
VPAAGRRGPANAHLGDTALQKKTHHRSQTRLTAPPSGDSDDETGEFTLDAAAVVAEEAVERKEARRVKPWLNELDVRCTGVAGAGGGPAGVEEDVEEHQDMNIACVAGT